MKPKRDFIGAWAGKNSELSLKIVAYTANYGNVVGIEFTGKAPAPNFIKIIVNSKWYSISFDRVILEGSVAGRFGEFLSALEHAELEDIPVLVGRLAQVDVSENNT